MKKLLLLLLCIVHCVLCIDIKAQDDAESMVSGDLEVEGLDNFWVESRLIINIDSLELQKVARPVGGNVAFLTHVQKYMSKVFNILFDKYPDETKFPKGFGWNGTTWIWFRQACEPLGPICSFRLCIGPKLKPTYVD